jgi:hypothetical protein
LLYSYIFIVTFVAACQEVVADHPAFVASIASIPQEVMMQVQEVIHHPCLVVAYLVAFPVASSVAFAEASVEAFLAVAFLVVASVVQAQVEQEAQVVVEAQ